MNSKNRKNIRRQYVFVFFVLTTALYFAVTDQNIEEFYNDFSSAFYNTQQDENSEVAYLTGEEAKSFYEDKEKTLQDLEKLEVKDRAPKTGYSRDEFGGSWADTVLCDVRNEILARDLIDVVRNKDCKVVSGILLDPYTAKKINFVRGADTSSEVQIDHVVALNDAWQKGAQQLSYAERVKFHNDSLNLLAVDGDANQQKSNSDAASWLPSNKAFRCSYVSRQVGVKLKYGIWVTWTEKEAIKRVLEKC